MVLHKFANIFLILFVMLMGLSPSYEIMNSHMTLMLNGTVGDDVMNPSSKVGNLQDAAYTYTGVDCVVYDYGVTIEGHVTIVVIDEGLHWKEWKALEQNPEANVDIVGFLTENSSDEIDWITDPDDLKSYTLQTCYGHGFAVISALAAIARDVEVIFVDLQYAESQFKADTYGFELSDESLWDWLDDNQSTFNMDIISSSIAANTAYANNSILDNWENLADNGVIMICAAGNEDSYMNYVTSKSEYYCYPQNYTEWNVVGSIDHETRTGESTKDQRSSFSSWFESYTAGNHIVNWLSPGNGIPVLEDPYNDTTLAVYRGTWRYAAGTSFSTPYLAGIIALIITGYHNGIGDYTDPTVQKVIDILQYASSRSTFNQKMGYGYVDAYLAYGKAYTEGRLAF
ncbi:hypothetical protein EU534_02770 [Candidatus Heimdallarchaeota archaeon]|nr:MAG: hypothetical protein EU534_02770 [Candidatus Heimdallarchaeota archaeon]